VRTHPASFAANLVLPVTPVGVPYILLRKERFLWFGKLPSFYPLSDSQMLPFLPFPANSQNKINC
jgi:hypothetical protein